MLTALAQQIESVLLEVLDQVTAFYGHAISRPGFARVRLGPMVSPYSDSAGLIQLKQSQVGDRTGCHQTHVQVGQTNREQAQPREQHVTLVKKRNSAPGAVSRPAGNYTREAIDVAADDVS